MTFEVVSVSLGATSTWTVEARGTNEARRIAREELRRVSNGYIVSVRPVGYKPKKDTN